MRNLSGLREPLARQISPRRRVSRRLRGFWCRPPALLERPKRERRKLGEGTGSLDWGSFGRARQPLRQPIMVNPRRQYVVLRIDPQESFRSGWRFLGWFRWAGRNYLRLGFPLWFRVAVRFFYSTLTLPPRFFYWHFFSGFSNTFPKPAPIRSEYRRCCD